MPIAVNPIERRKEKDDLDTLVKLTTIGSSIYGMTGKAAATPAASGDVSNVSSPAGKDYLGTGDSTNLVKEYATSPAVNRRLETLKLQSPDYLGFGKKSF